jgi:hypothetical protein
MDIEEIEIPRRRVAVSPRSTLGLGIKSTSSRVLNILIHLSPNLEVYIETNLSQEHTDLFLKQYQLRMQYRLMIPQPIDMAELTAITECDHAASTPLGEAYTITVSLRWKNEPGP